MVSFIIEAPLADDQVSTRVFATLDHVVKLVLLNLVEFIVIFSTLDFKSVFGLGLRGFKGAGEDGYFTVFDFGYHLRVTEFLVEYDSALHFSVTHIAAYFAFHFNQVEVDVTCFHVTNCKYCFDTHFGQFVLLLIDHLAAQSSHSSINQLRSI